MHVYTTDSVYTYVPTHSLQVSDDIFLAHVCMATSMITCIYICVHSVYISF